MDETTPAAGSRELVYASVIVSAYLARNQLALGEIPGVIRSVHSALVGLASPVSTEVGAPKPAVSIKKSVAPDYIICLEDGKKLTMLKRYLRTRYNLTPDAYRAKWNLPPDYPLVAPNFAAKRSAFAKKMGLGRRTKIPKARSRKRA